MNESGAEEIRRYRTGGGVVLDARGALLLLERHVPREEGLRHEIRLPKGHIDEGETAEEAGRREVCEESGYCALEILADLGTSEVRYQFRGARYEREERYFLMRLQREERQPPQVHEGSEESLFEVRWASGFDEAEQLLTYEPEREVVRRARAAWEARSP